MSTVGSDKTQETLYAVGTKQDRGAERPSDSTDARAAHRHDRMSYREDLKRLECSCDACDCGDMKVCIEKRCGCCTV